MLGENKSPQSIAQLSSPNLPESVKIEDDFVAPKGPLNSVAENEGNESDFPLSDEEVEMAYESFDEIVREMFERTHLHGQMFDRYNLPLTEKHFLPAYNAALKSDLDTLKKIAGLNISLDKVDMKTGETPLHAACRRGNIETVDFICSKVKNHSPLNRNGMTPFYLAVANGNSELVFLMLRRGSLFSTAMPDFDGRSPLMAAGLNGYIEIFKILKNIGQDYLKHDKNERSLLSQLSPSDPIYKLILTYIKRDIKNDKARTINRIAADLSCIYKSGAKNQFKSILKLIGISMFDLINTPQSHASNFLLTLLEMKEYRLYRHYVNDAERGFDINSATEIDKYSFVEACLQSASIDSIEYLLNNDNPTITERSIKAIIYVDRVEALQLLVDEHQFELPLFIGNEDIVTFSGIAKANSCFKYLLRKLWDNEDLLFNSTNIFCQAASRICEAESYPAVSNLFKTFAKGLRQCSISELDSIKESLYEHDENVDNFLRVVTMITRNKRNMKSSLDNK